MDKTAIAQHILSLPVVETSEAYGYQFFFYRDDHRLPFATIADSDNEYDSVSNLDREGVFRLNIGVSKATFQSLFPGKVAVDSFDFTLLDQFLPHPDYHKQFFICVLSPGEANLGRVKEFLAEAWEISKKRYDKRFMAIADDSND